MSGQPLLSWPVRAALESGIFSAVIVTTDDDEIAAAAVAAGATVPFMRRPELSDDWTPTVPVVADAIDQLAAQGSEFDVVCCLYPGAIFVSGRDVRDSLSQLIARPEADFLATVTEYPTPLELAMDLDSEGHLSHVNPAAYGQRTQDLPTRYYDVGQFYWGKSASWLTTDNLYNNAIGYVLPKWRAQDIDTEDDWTRAQYLHTTWLAESDTKLGGEQ